MPERDGKAFGRYQLLEELGQGGMAEVYRAYDTHLETQVAVKVIRGERTGDRLFARRFEREARALAALVHPNIVAVIDFGEHEGTPFLVMPYLPGGTLKSLTGLPLSSAQAARLIAPVARALDFAHRRGIIHRDVKPSNILLTASGEPMLSDFGIAKLVEENGGTHLTATGLGVGTPDYMPPEQWEGQVVPQTDQYALGIILYELVTGRRPFQADTPVSAMRMHVLTPPPRPKKLVPNLPDEMERLILRALAKKPADRYPSLAEFAARLEKLAAAPPERTGALFKKKTPARADPRKSPPTPGQANSPSRPAPGKEQATRDDTPSQPRPSNPLQSSSVRTAKRFSIPRLDFPRSKALPASPRPRQAINRRVLAAAGAGILVLVAALLAIRPEYRLTTATPTGLAIAVRAGTETRPPTAQPTASRPAALTQTHTSLPPAANTPAASPTPEYTATPSEARYLEIGPANLNRLAKTGSYGQGGLVSARWSPDGRYLAVGALSLMIHDALTGGEVYRFDTGGAVTASAISPDGRWAAAGLSSGQLQLWSLETGQKAAEFTIDAAPLGLVDFSPDSTGLVASGEDGMLHLLEAGQPWQETRVFQRAEKILWAAFLSDKQYLVLMEENDQAYHPLVCYFSLQIGDCERGVAIADPLYNLTNLVLSSDEQWVYGITSVFEGSFHSYFWRWNLRSGDVFRSRLPAEGIAIDPLNEVILTGGDCSPEGCSYTRLSIESFASTGNLVIKDLQTPPDKIQFSAGMKSALAWYANGIKLYRIEMGARMVYGNQQPGEIIQILLSQDEKQLVIGSGTFEPHGPSVTNTWLYHLGETAPSLVQQEGASHIGLSNDGALLYTGRTVLDPSSGAAVHNLDPGLFSSNYQYSAMAPDGSLIASLVDNKAVRLVDARDGTVKMTIYTQGNVKDIQFSPDSQLVNISTYFWINDAADSQLEQYTAATGSRRGVLAYLIDPEKYVFSPDGAWMGLIAENQIDIFHLATYRKTLTLIGSQLAFSPDSNLIAASQGSSVVFYDQEGAELHRINLPYTEITALAFSPKATYLAVGSREGITELWAVKE